MDYEPAYSTVDCVVGLVESAHADHSTFPLPLPPLLLRCCVPKLFMCPSITGFQCIYVGIFYAGDMNRKTDRKNGVSFSVSLFWGNEETTSKRRFRLRKNENKRPKNRLDHNLECQAVWPRP